MAVERKLRILALDGGSRPSVMLQLLNGLEDLVPGYLDSVDIFAGNSAGSMTCALMLSHPTFKAGLKAAESFWDPSTFPKGKLFDQVMAITGRYPMQRNDNLIKRLLDFLGDLRMCDLRRKLIVPAFCLDVQASEPMYRTWSPRLFNNLNPDQPESQDLVRDVVMRSSSAPIVSPVYQKHIDGAIFANNPSLCAITLALDSYDAALTDIEVLSVGMGQNPIYMDFPTNNLGYADWLFDANHPLALLNAVAESNLKAINYQCGRLLRESFYRLDPRLTKAVHVKPSVLKSQKDSIQTHNLERDVASAAGWLKSHRWQAQAVKEAVVTGGEKPPATKRKKRVPNVSSASKQPRQRGQARSKSPSKS